MVGRGAVSGLGLCLAVAFVACGGSSYRSAADSGEDDEPETGGGKAMTGGRNGNAGGSAGVMTPSAGRMGGVGGDQSNGGVPQGGASGATDGCTSAGGRVGEDGCAIPWWGSSLDGAKGVLACPDPYDPAILAYGQTNLPACYALSGPVAELVSSDGGHECCYHLDERGCCGSTFESDFCVAVPYFGDGTRTEDLPRGQLDDPYYACEEAHGETATFAASDAAERLIGVWLTCGAMPAPFIGDGFVFRGDGTFHVVEFDEDFELTEAHGCTQGGLWGFLTSTGQLNLHIEDFTQMYNPVSFTVEPNEWLVLDSYEFVRAQAPAGG